MDEPNTLRLRLIGDQAQRGRIPAADVGRLLLGAERVIAHAVGHVRRQQLKERGRWGKTVEDAVATRFIAIEDGSFIAVIGVPPPPPADTVLLQAATLTEMAVDDALALANASDGAHEWHDVAAAFVDWANELGIGTRYEALEIEHRSPQRATRATLNAAARERLEVVAEAPTPPVRPDKLVGRLVEADFERETGRLRTPTGHKIEIEFDASREDDMQDALRHEAEVTGEVRLDAKARPKSVRLQRIEMREQLELGIEAAELPPQRSIEDLASERHATPFERGQDLRLKSIRDDEIADYFAALETLDA